MLRIVGAVALLWVTLGALAAGASENRERVPTAEQVAATELGAPLSDVERSALRSIASESTVRVAARTCEGFQLGSGFVAMGHLITNRHLVSGASEMKIDQPIDPVLLPIARRATGLDLAVGAPVGSAQLEFAESNPAVGSTVVMAGHAGGGETLMVEGAVQLFDDGAPWGVDGPVMMIDGSTTGGFSGGPVLDRSGRVVGVLQGYSPTVDLTIAIPVESVRGWVLSADDDPNIADCSFE